MTLPAVTRYRAIKIAVKGDKVKEPN